MRFMLLNVRCVLGLFSLLALGVVQAEEIDNFPVHGQYCIPSSEGSEELLEFKSHYWTFKKGKTGIAHLSCPITLMNNMKDEYDEELDYSIRLYSMNAFDHDREETRASVEVALLGQTFFSESRGLQLSKINTNNRYFWSSVASDVTVRKFQGGIYKDGKDYIVMKPGFKYSFSVEMRYDPIVNSSCIETYYASCYESPLSPRFYGILLHQKTFMDLPYIGPEELIDPEILDPVGTEPVFDSDK